MLDKNYFSNTNNILNNKFDHLVSSSSFNTESEMINFLDTVINSTIEGIVVFDENKICIRANDSACSMFNYEKNEIIGKFAFDLISKDYRELVKNSMKIKNQSPYEALMLKKDGSEFPALLRGRDITINGKLFRISAIVDLSELKNKEKRIFHIAYFDKLTKLPNRQRMILDMKTFNVHACVIFNIDKFGELNDLFGSDIGDNILVKFAEELEKENINPYRIGGDEFAVLFDEKTDYKKLELFIDSMINKIEKIEFLAQNEPFRIHVRAGAAINGNKLLTHADIAVREAKAKKTPFFIYDESKRIEDKYKKNLAMSITIHKAIDNNRLICYYQPIINNASGKTVKYETLVRLKDETGRILSPAEFLPIAKTTRLYPQITKQVIKQACELFSDKNIDFSVNVSIDDINNKEVVDFIIDTLQKTKTGKKIVFEILETEGIENYDKVVEFISLIKSFGAEVAIDDFGSGYSNFKHLLSLNIDYIKIDGSLIKNINESKKNLIIVETIIDFAKKIGARTVAEFVSSAEIFEMVKKLGINCSQGFYLGKPAPNLH